MRTKSLEERVQAIEDKLAEMAKPERAAGGEGRALDWMSLIAAWPGDEDDFYWSSAADLLALVPTVECDWTSVSLGRRFARVAAFEIVIHEHDGTRWTLAASRDNIRHQKQYRPVPLP